MSDAFNQMLAQGPTPIKFADPVNQMAQLMQLKNYQQTGVVNQMAIDKGQRDQADQASLRNMLGQTGFNVNDPTQRAQLLGYEGGPDIVSALDTSALNKSKLTEANNKAITNGILNSQNLLANVDPDAPDAVPRLKAIMSASFQNPELAGFLAMHGQTEQGALDSIDQAANSGKLKGWYTSAMSNAESVRKSMELQGTPQSNEGRIQADMARLPLDSPERAALQAVIDKRGRFAPDDAADVTKPPSGYRFLPDGNLIAISGGPADRPANAVKEDFETVNGIPYRRTTDGTLAAVIDQATGLPFVKASTVPVLTPLQQRKEARLKLNDKAGIDRLKAGLRSMTIPIYGLDNPAETDAAGNVIKAAGKTPGLLSPGVKTSGIEGVSGLIPSIYGSNASRAESLLESVNNQMKSVGRELLTSDDQGKLGNFAVKEWQIAADAVATINPRKDPDGWKVKLDEIVRRLETRIKLKEDEFEELYLDGEQSNAPSAEEKPAAGGVDYNNPLLR